MSAATYEEIIKISQKFTQPALEICVTEHLPTETVQAKCHKRKSSRRWQKKWLKKFGTKEVSGNEIYRIGNKIIMSPAMHRIILKKIQQKNRDFFDHQASMLWNGF